MSSPKAPSTALGSARVMNLLNVLGPGDAPLPLKPQSSLYSACLPSWVASITTVGIWSRCINIKASNMALTGYLGLPLPELLYLASMRFTVWLMSRLWKKGLLGVEGGSATSHHGFSPLTKS